MTMDDCELAATVSKNWGSNAVFLSDKQTDEQVEE
jgi:hypothetical protein